MEEHHHTNVYIAGLGTIEFRYVSVRDVEAFFTLMEEAQNLTDREFVLAVLHQQLISPSLTIERLRTLSDKDISRMAVAFMQGEPTLFKEVGDTDEVYTTFRSALEQHAAAYQERAQKYLESFRVEAERKLEGVRSILKNIQQRIPRLTLEGVLVPESTEIRIPRVPSPEEGNWKRHGELIDVMTGILAVQKAILEEQKDSSTLNKKVYSVACWSLTVSGIALLVGIAQVYFALFPRVQDKTQHTPTATTTISQTKPIEKKLPEIRAYSPKG